MESARKAPIFLKQLAGYTREQEQSLPKHGSTISIAIIKIGAR